MRYFVFTCFADRETIDKSGTQNIRMSWGLVVARHGVPAISERLHYPTLATSYNLAL